MSITFNLKSAKQMQPRLNTPSFDTFVKTPKTQDDVFRCVESKDMFLALVPFRYETCLLSLCPAIVFSVQDNEYRKDWLNGTCEKSKEHFNFHAIALHIQDMRFMWLDDLFICSKYTLQTSIAEVMHPLPEWYLEFLESYINDPSIDSSSIYHREAVESWGKFADHRLYWVWRALKSKEQLSVNTETALKKEYEDAQDRRRKMDQMQCELLGGIAFNSNTLLDSLNA